MGVLLLAVVTLSSSGEASGFLAHPPPEQGAAELAPLDSAWVEARLRSHRVPGVAIAVVDSGRIVWAGGFGHTDSRSLVPVDTSTLFQAASISKPVAAFGSLLLVQQGILDLDGDVDRRLVSWRIPEAAATSREKVTLRRLLSHSAGTTVHGFRGYAAGEAVPSLVQVLNGEPPANSAPVRVESVPGSAWRYSGGGTSIVQQLITDVTGAPFREFMRSAVLEPLGMHSSTYEQPIVAPLAARAATGHDARGEVIAGRWHTYPEEAAAGLWSTAADLARFVIGVNRSFTGASDSMLESGLAREMKTVQSGSYGLGFVLAGCGGSTCFSHGGANEGFRAYLIGVMETGQGAVVMTNGDGGAALAAEIVRRIAGHYGWPGAPR